MEAPADPSPLRYVVLRHDGVPDAHFDLMFETEPRGPLRTWRSPAWPIPGRTGLTPLHLHRREYLDYECPVSGGRGHVTRVAAGTYTIEAPDPSTWEFHLTGQGDGERLRIRTWRDTQGRELWDASGCSSND
jgi:hypothetical protein